VKGFKVYDKGTLVGKIIGFSSNNAQDLLIVETSNKEVEIPFVQAFVVKMDSKNKKIEMDLPEGLVEFSDDEKSDEDSSEEN